MERTIQRLERVHADTKEDTILTITKRWWEQMDNYRDYANLLIESMRVSNNSNRFVIEVHILLILLIYSYNSYLN